MGKAMYIGDSSNKARKIKKIYIGDASGKARKVKKIYIGDSNGKARLCWTLSDALFVMLTGESSSTIDKLIQYSEDGRSWKQVYSSAFQTHFLMGNNPITYGMGKIVVADYTRAIYYSTDKGLTWTYSTNAYYHTNGTNSVSEIVYNNGVFYMVSNYYSDSSSNYYTSVLQKSTDGINFSYVGQFSPSGVINPTHDFTVFKGILIALNTTAIWYSTTGVSSSWTQAYYANVSGYKIAQNNDMLILVGRGKTYISTDGKAFSLKTNNLTSFPSYGVMWCNNKFVAITQTAIATSTDGITWTDISTFNKANSVNYFGYNNGVYVLLSASTAYYSTDLINWTLSSNYVAKSYVGCEYPVSTIDGGYGDSI